jgi:hypothetical protein
VRGRGGAGVSVGFVAVKEGGKGRGEKGEKRMGWDEKKERTHEILLPYIELLPVMLEF